MVLTGGTSLLPGIRTVASRVLGVPVRIAQPGNMVGMTDRLDSPAFSTSVGLIQWGLMMNELMPEGGTRRATRNHTGSERSFIQWDRILKWLKRLLP